MEGDFSKKVHRFILATRHVPCLGIILALFSGAFSATGGFVVKLIPAIHPVEVVIWR